MGAAAVSAVRFVRLSCEEAEGCKESVEIQASGIGQARYLAARDHGWTYSPRIGERCPRHPSKLATPIGAPRQWL
jgi:hypothetical protein